MMETPRPQPPEIAAFEAAVVRLRGGDATLPIHVLVPNHLLGVWLARSIFAETGHFAIDFLLPHELAWRLAAPRLLPEGQAPVPEYVDQALLLAAIAEAAQDDDTPDHLRAASSTPGFAPAALRTLQELESAGIPPEALERAAPATADPGRLRLLARLMRARQQRLRQHDLLDRPALFRAAAVSLPSPQLGAVIIDGAHVLTQAAAGLVAALRLHVKVADLAAGPEPAPAPTSALERAQQRLFARTDAQTPRAPLDPSLRLLSAAGEGLEAVEIARRILGAVDDGLRFDEIAVLLRDPRPYAAHLAAAFDRASIPGYFFEGTPQLDPAARGLWLLLDLLGGDLDRGRVMELLTTAQVPWDDLLGPGATISPARWDRLSSQSGIVSGLDMWHARLDAALARAAGISDTAWRDRDTALAQTLRQVIDKLAADLEAFPKEGGWGELLDATLHLLKTWNRAPERTESRLETVLRPLARFAPRPTRDELLARVRSLLATQTYTEGELGAGRVFVGSVAAARGIRFRLVFVPGLVERGFPGVVRPDPLLLDDDRQALSPDLPTTRHGYDDERRLFHDAVRAATERLVLSYPRFEGARERVPSSFLMRAVEAALGHRLSAAELLERTEAGETALGRPHPQQPDRAIDTLERDLALVASGAPGAASHLAEPDSFVARSLARHAAQATPTLTSFDGLVDTAANAAALERISLTHGAKSATRLEALATCPYRHLLYSGFRLRRWEEPDRAYQIEGKDYGGIFHRVMEAVFRELHETGRLPLDEAGLAQARDRARERLDTELEGLRQTGEIVHPALLEPTAARLWADLDEALEREARAATGEWTPGAFEQRFEGVPFELDPGRVVSFNGTIDRIDFASHPDRLRVVDYKTGKSYWKRDEQLQGGRALQLPIYNLAAESLYPDHRVDEAQYYYATSDGKYSRKECPNTPENRDSLRRILATVEDLVQGGVLAPDPLHADPNQDNCRFCDFTDICGPDRQARAERKRSDPRLAAFRALRDIP